MKIAVCGPQCTGKSTFIKDFIKNWPNYKTPDDTYRDLVKKKKLKINQKGDNKSQKIIFDYQVDTIKKYQDEKNIIFDRCVLDPIAYSLWMYEKGIGNITEDDIHDMLKECKEVIKLYDIIFLTPVTSVAPVKIVADKKNPLRDTDEEFRNEINNIFNAMMQSYFKQSQVIFPTEDCPAFIEIFGNPQERIEMAKLYINPEGEAFDEESNLIQEAIQPTLEQAANEGKVLLP